MRSRPISPPFAARSRREFLAHAAACASLASPTWLAGLAAQAGAARRAGRACILLWMNGGPSQLDTFDLKPKTPNGGPFLPIATNAAGLMISEHLPQLAQQGRHLAVLRSLSTKEGDHSRATHLVRNGYLPQAPIRYPTLGSLVAKELGDPGAELPAFVSVAPYRQFAPAAYGPGFLGSAYDPLLVGDGNTAPSAPAADGSLAYEELRVADLAAPANVARDQVDRRLELLAAQNERFLAAHPTPGAWGHRIAYERAVRLMHSAAGQAFDLDEEPAAIRERYGRSRFGQGCLLARRLVERGVPFVEVTLSGTAADQNLGWDTHTDNFTAVRALSQILDPAFATLLTELAERGLLESTLVVWMGEFGRTPKINPNGGRDHFPQAWSSVLAGAGVKGGQVIGATTADGMAVETRPLGVPDLLFTVCTALGIDPFLRNISNVGRPISLVDPAGQIVEEVFS